MKRVYRHTSVAELGLVRGLLEGAGIRCTTRNEQLAGALGGIALVQPELWVIDEADYSRARALIDSHVVDSKTADSHRSNGQRARDWVCARCHERNEGQFAACWNCGAADETDSG